jgi:serine-protein kinase ATM
MQSKARTSSASRLSSTATALRLTVEAAIGRIRFKTATSVIDHIIGTLPTPDDDFCEPLRNDYLKSFRLILDYPSYGEHLKAKQWQEYVDFALAGITVALRDDEQDTAPQSSRDASMTSRNGNPLSIRVSQSSTSKSFRSGAKSSLDDILSALRSLTAFSNAPILSRAHVIIDSIFDCLISAQRAHDASLEVLNNVALILMTENVELLVKVLSRLVPFLFKMWSSKSTSLRDQILIFLSVVRPLFLANRDSVGHVEQPLREKILEVLENDYMERASRDLLHLGDVSIELLSFGATQEAYYLVPRREYHKSAANWSLLASMASLICGLSQSSSRSITFSESTAGNKRRKVAKPAENVLKRIINVESFKKLAAIQIIFFICHQSAIPVLKEVEEEMVDLEALLLHDDPGVVSWTMLALSRYAINQSQIQS